MRLLLASLLCGISGLFLFPLVTPCCKENDLSQEKLSRLRGVIRYLVKREQQPLRYSMSLGYSSIGLKDVKKQANYSIRTSQLLDTPLFVISF